MAIVKFHQKAILLNREGRFLALKASYKKLKWDLPGGNVEIPENNEEALRREVMEECSLKIDNITPFSVETAYNKEDDSYVIFIGYKCQAVGDSVVLSDEHTEYKWVTRDEFMKLEATPYLYDFVRKMP